jgi:S-DNA-T family DNA segregation ATPase FtsK/SpoIIIE
VAIADAGSRNGTSVDGHRLADGEQRDLRPENHVEVGRSLLQVRPIVVADDAFARNGRPHVDFNRGPRVVAIPRSATVEVEPPPARPGRARLPLVTSVAPLGLGVAMFLIVGEPTMLLFSALTPVMAVSSFLSDRRSGHKDYRQRLAVFRGRASRLDAELQAARDEEVAERRGAAPDAATLATRATRHLPSLWERRRDDEDCLRLRLGTADQSANLTVSFPDGGDPHEREPVEARIRASARLPSVSRRSAGSASAAILRRATRSAAGSSPKPPSSTARASSSAARSCRRSGRRSRGAGCRGCRTPLRRAR